MTATHASTAPENPTFAIVDLETTGLDHEHDRVVEVAICVTDADFTPLETWHTMIDPEVPVLNSEIHGLTDEHLVTAPTFGEVIPAMRERLSGLRLVAHNAGFDAGFLAAECQRAGTEFCPDPTFVWIDSLHLARRTLTGSHRLDALCQRFRITNPAPHTALGDVLATAGVLRAMQATRPGLGRQLRESAPVYVFRQTEVAPTPCPSLPRCCLPLQVETRYR